MKKFGLIFKAWSFITVPLLLSFAIIEKKQLTIFLIGDSTVSQYSLRQSPLTGWGMPFTNFFDSTVVVKNKAKSGRSTRTFVEEGFWSAILDSLKSGDYVFIQFGHNDEVKSKKSYTTEIEFKNNLIKYVSETRKKSAIPVLLTPVARRNFDAQGKLVPTHEFYSSIVRSVAKDWNVPLIDLDKKSQDLLKELGPEKSAMLYNHLEPGENPNFPQGKQDDTHFNELGARRIAEIVLAEIKSLQLDLSRHIFKPVS